MRTPKLAAAVLLATLAAFPRPAAAGTRVSDVARVAGGQTNVLTGMGLVVGLKGTGDGAAYQPAIRPLAQLLSHYGSGSAPSDLSGVNCAIVMVTATIPADGTHAGSHLDVRVSSVGAATSLRGGELYMVSMFDSFGHAIRRTDPETKVEYDSPWAIANGPVHVEDDSTPTTGVVAGGAQMEVTTLPKYIDNHGQFTLVISDPSASWQTAGAIAKMINEMADTGEVVAVAGDTKNVLVRIPAAERDRPDGFLASVLKLPVPTGPVEARVRINRKTGTMVITGDVEITPSVISHKGLTITTTTPPPSPRTPQTLTKNSVPLDTTGTGGAKLQDLAAAFDQLKVPAEDRLAIVQELYDLGQLHAKLNVDGEDK